MLASALVTETDSLNGALLETLTLNIVSQGSLRDVQNYLDTIGFTVQGLTTALDRQDYTETLAILAAGLEGLSDRQHYIDRALSFYLAPVNQDAIYNGPTWQPNSPLKFKVYVPQTIVSGQQVIIHSQKNDLLCYVDGQSIYFGNPSTGDLLLATLKKGAWNDVEIDYNETGSTVNFTFKVNGNIYSGSRGTQFGNGTYFYCQYYFGDASGFFGANGYRVIEFSGAYHFSVFWIDAEKTRPARIGDVVEVIENDGSNSGDITYTLVSGETQQRAIVKGFAPPASLSTILQDIQAYIDALSITATVTVKITESYLGTILEALGFTITSTETITDAQGYKERIGIAATAGTGEADAQHFADSLGLTMHAAVTVSDLAALAERLNVIATAVITGVDRQSIREMLSDLWTSLIAVSDAYTPRDLPRVVFEFFYSRERSIKQSRRNRHFEQAEKGRHVGYDK